MKALFYLIFSGFECEGLVFKAFTANVAFYADFLLIFSDFTV